MSTQAAGVVVPGQEKTGKKKLVRRAAPDGSQTDSPGGAVVFVALNVWIGGAVFFGVALV